MMAYISNEIMAYISNEMNGVLGHDFSLVRLCRAGNKLG